MSDTPLTDAKERESEKCKPKLHAHYGWKFARRLERQLSKSQARVAELQKYYDECTCQGIMP